MCIRDSALIQLLDGALLTHDLLCLILTHAVLIGDSGEVGGTQGGLSSGRTVSYTHLDVYKRQGDGLEHGHDVLDVGDLLVGDEDVGVLHHGLHAVVVLSLIHI